MNLKNKFTLKHSFHLVNPSPWPITGALSLLTLVVGAVSYLHQYRCGGYILFIGYCLLICVLVGWWRDVIREATFAGMHTRSVRRGMRIGVYLFILSEIMFFAGFFWGFFHSSLVPDFHIGNMFPPKGINIIDPWKLPLANTLLLLSSGATLTWAHHGILTNSFEDARRGLALTIFLGTYFTVIQAYEFVTATFTIADGIYGSAFYLLTGFHGLHVLVGSVFLITCYIRLKKHHFLLDHHFNFEAAAWYWHFVDVVWIFLFLFLYWWGGSSSNNDYYFIG